MSSLQCSDIVLANQSVKLHEQLKCWNAAELDWTACKKPFRVHLEATPAASVNSARLLRFTIAGPGGASLMAIVRKDSLPTSRTLLSASPLEGMGSLQKCVGLSPVVSKEGQQTTNVVLLRRPLRPGVPTIQARARARGSSLKKTRCASLCRFRQGLITS